MMEKQITSQRSSYEQMIVGIIRRLPLERVLQLVDFARFLEFQMTGGNSDRTDTGEVKSGEKIQSGEEKWDSLLARPEAKRVLREMAHEALAEYRADHTTDVSITEDGRLAPG